MQAQRSTWLVSALLFFLLMIGLGAIPGQANALSERFGDKLLHTLAYGFLCLLCYRGLHGSPRQRYAGSLCIVALLGLFDEGVQHFLPYRNTSLLDWCFDVGAALMVICFIALQKRFSMQRSTEPQRDSHHAK